MPGTAEPQIIVRTGAADPASLALPSGLPIGPLSIGRRGTWRLVAPGVLEEHGFVYFNGTDLFLQSTDPLSPVLANGTPIPGDWTLVHAPCEIAVGGARLWFGSPEPTFAPLPIDDVALLNRQPFAPRVQGNDFEAATRVQPIEETRHARGPLPAAGAPFAAPLPVLGPGATPPLTPPLSPPPGLPVAPPAPQSFIAARWREASGPKKALFVLMVPLVWAVWVIFTDAPAPPTPKPAASATTQPSAAPRMGASSAAPATTEPPPTMPTTEAPAGTSSARVATSSSPATTGPKTPQREAADAVAAGAFDRASKLYDELAKAHPEVTAYAEAARIMKAKAGKR
jgi:hypothetical protein